MTTAEFEELVKFAAFGRAALELAKEHGIVPKRQKVVVREKVKTRVVVRRPRRTKAQMQAAAAAVPTEVFVAGSSV
jgi:ubiquinone biosynthesis protein COQ9